MEIKTLSFDFKFVKTAERDVVKPVKVESVTVRTIWDSHGSHVPWEGEDGKKSRTYKDATIKVVRTSGYYDFGNPGDKDRVYDTDTLYINGEKFDALDIYSVKGNTSKVNITACVGQG